AELHRVLENISSEYNNYYYMNNVLNGSKEAKLNKLFFEDYEYYMDNSLFSYKSIAPVQTIKLTDAERSALNKRYPEKNDLM
ncbi:MAG: hypothetical protein LIO96_00255, partial [Lachnospiraceae bacterium]|nr:hypothetical protein [Lachnospiraceae bacterium]